MLPSLLIVGLLAGQPRPEPLEDWAGYLRDALTHSQALAREGRAHVYVEYESEHEGKPFKAELEGDIEWSGELLYESFAAASTSTFAFGFVQAAGLRASPPLRLVVTPNAIALYNGTFRSIFVEPNEDPSFAGLFQFHPSQVWYSRQAVPSAKSKSWIEWLDRRPRNRDGVATVIAFTREPNDIVRQRSTYPDGTRAIHDFSLRHGGNIVRWEFLPSAEIDHRLVAEYEWARQGEAFILKSTRREADYGDAPLRPFKYRAVYSNVKLGPQDPAQFTLDRVEREVVGKTSVRDHIRNRSYSIAGKSEDGHASFDRLIGVVLSRGFARRGGRP